MVDAQPAVGMLEVQGLSRGLTAANVAVRAAAVNIDGIGYIQGGGVMVAVRGEIAAVEAAVGAAAAAVPEGAVHAVARIGRPDAALGDILAEREMIRPGVRTFSGRGGVGSSRMVPVPESTSPSPSARRRPKKKKKKQEEVSADDAGATTPSSATDGARQEDDDG